MKTVLTVRTPYGANIIIQAPPETEHLFVGPKSAEMYTIISNTFARFAQCAGVIQSIPDLIVSGETLQSDV